jgi:thiol-disulfide isomerase/thioredoxin
MTTPTQKLLSIAMGAVVLTSSIVTIFNQTQPSLAETRMAAMMAKPLASELQGKPVVVDIYASWCGGCKNIASTLATLKQRYQGKVNFVVFDVTDRTTTQAAEARAQQLGLAEFLASNKSQTSTVAIIDPKTGKILRQFRNNPNSKDYMAILDTEIAQMGKMDRMGK